MITPFWKNLSSLFAKGCSCRVRYYSVHKCESVEKQSSSKQKSTSMVLFSNFMTVGGRGNLLVVSMYISRRCEEIVRNVTQSWFPILRRLPPCFELVGDLSSDFAGKDGRDWSHQQHSRHPRWFTRVFHERHWPLMPSKSSMLMEMVWRLWDAWSRNDHLNGINIYIYTPVHPRILT